MVELILPNAENLMDVANLKDVSTGQLRSKLRRGTVSLVKRVRKEAVNGRNVNLATVASIRTIFGRNRFQQKKIEVIGVILELLPQTAKI